MSLYLFGTFIAFLLNIVLIIPFINFLYKIKFQRGLQQTKDAFNKPTPIFDKFHNHKKGVPVGGGILVIATTVILFFMFIVFYFLFDQKLHSNFPSAIGEISCILFAFISFAILGIFDDLKKIFVWKNGGHIGLRLRHKFIIEIVLGLVIACILYFQLKINFIYIPFIGVIPLGFFYIPFAAFVIVAFSNAVNITDGLDGLSTGVLVIALTGFWAVARSIADDPTSIFTGIWLGGLVAFLYFNIYPARIMLGDTGALSFGAAFAVIGLVLGKAFVLPIMGGVFVLEIVSSLIQLLGKKFFKRKIMTVAPIHLYLQNKGWEEPKIVMRLWVITGICVVFGLTIAFM